MEDRTLDQLVMLLSTDWFFEHWPRIGIAVSSAEAAILHAGFRDIVRQIVSGAERYWLASFSTERLQETSLMLERLLKRSGVRESTAARVRELGAGRPGASIDDRIAWLLLAIAGMLRDNSLGEEAEKLAPSIRAILIDAYRSSEADSFDFEAANLRSRRQWDEYVRSLTPDLPTYLSDYVSAVLLKRSEFERFWNLVRTAATPDQRQELLVWYRFEGKVLTGEEVNLPPSLSE